MAIDTIIVNDIVNQELCKLSKYPKTPEVLRSIEEWSHPEVWATMPYPDWPECWPEAV